MEDKCILIYNEVVALHQKLEEYHNSMDKRVSALEKFRDKLLGITLAVGVACKCAWDYVVERII